MKLLVFSDIHLDAVTAGKSRRSEVLDFLWSALDVARQAQVDAVIFAGDAHDPGQPNDALYSADLIRFVTAVVRASFKPHFIAIAGNHDVVDSSERFMSEPVTTLTPLRAAALAMPEEVGQRVHIIERPHLRVLKDNWGVLGLPYVSRAHAAEAVVWEDLALRQAQEFADKGGRLIVVGHLTIPGAEMSSETTDMARGRDRIFPFERVSALKPALAMNGHYHRRQTFVTGDLSIVIPGSPVRFTFGEIEEVDKGVFIVEL